MTPSTMQPHAQLSELVITTQTPCKSFLPLANQDIPPLLIYVLSVLPIHRVL